MIAQEVFHGLKRRDRRAKDSVAVKLDMSKAYDRLEWSFLRNALLCYGFCSAWVDLIMELVSTVTYKYKVNGFVSKVLKPGRGLRQGDPLSPYLFILAADVLSHMMRRAQTHGDIKGLLLAPGAPILTHLFFADDALIFAKATEEEMFQIVSVLNTYCQASGQRINLSKSGLICGKAIPRGLQVKLATILKMQIWINPGKYLGLPADWGRSRSAALSWIKERILSKVDGWKESLLNQAGKEVLIKAVLQAIPAYAMSVVRFPKVSAKIFAPLSPNSGGLLMGKIGEFTGNNGKPLQRVKRKEGWDLKTLNI